MKHEILWTNDCGGKKNYDGPLVSVSSRFWPQGGGFLIFNNGQFEDNETRPHIKPSANSTIYIGEKEVVSMDFEAETEKEVMDSVESWVQEQFEKIVSTLSKVFEISNQEN